MIRGRSCHGCEMSNQVEINSQGRACAIFQTSGGLLKCSAVLETRREEFTVECTALC